MDEIWMPSPCYSTSRGPYNKVVLHTTEGAMTIESLGNFFANKGNQVSSHFGADNQQRGVVGAYVMEHHGAWTQGNANPYCLSLEMCGYSYEWTRQDWLDTQDSLLDNAAEWVAWMCAKYDIPLRGMTDSQAQDPNYRGVCQHRQFGAWGGGHVDCGNMPFDVVMERAKGGTVQTGGITVAGVAFDSGGRPWEVGSWKGNGQINVKVGDSPFAAIDSTQTGAKSGPTIAYDPVHSRMRVVFINKYDEMVCYTTAESPIDWGFAKLGGQFQG